MASRRESGEREREKESGNMLCLIFPSPTPLGNLRKTLTLKTFRPPDLQAFKKSHRTQCSVWLRRPGFAAFLLQDDRVIRVENFVIRPQLSQSLCFSADTHICWF